MCVRVWRERERKREREFILKERCTEPYQKLTVLMDVFEDVRGVKGIVNRGIGCLLFLCTRNR